MNNKNTVHPNPQMYTPNAPGPINNPQPGQPAIFMVETGRIPGCPPGLEYLTQINSLKVEQLVEFIEVFTGFETNNKYVIRNQLNQQVFYAAEETDFCMRVCCNDKRGFTIYIIDNMRQPVMKIEREFKCCAGCCWFAGSCECCAYEVSIEAPIGTPIGYVKQAGSFWIPCYDILNENHEKVLSIEGPVCIFDGPCCPITNEFQVLTLENAQIGMITKEYSGFLREAFTKSDVFGISFPIDLNVKTKATLLGALFLIDFMFFEKNQNNNNNNNY